jgi:hypothetical protein
MRFMEERTSQAEAALTYEKAAVVAARATAAATELQLVAVNDSLRAQKELESMLRETAETAKLKAVDAESALRTAQERAMENLAEASAAQKRVELLQVEKAGSDEVLRVCRLEADTLRSYVACGAPTAPHRARPHHCHAHTAPHRALPRVPIATQHRTEHALIIATRSHCHAFPLPRIPIATRTRCHAFPLPRSPVAMRSPIALSSLCANLPSAARRCSPPPGCVRRRAKRPSSSPRATSCAHDVTS